MSSKIVRTIPNVSVVLNDGEHTDASVPASLHFHENETVTVQLEGHSEATEFTIGPDILRELRSK